MKENISLVKKTVNKEVKIKDVDYNIINIYITKYLTKKYKDIVSFPIGINFFVIVSDKNKNILDFGWDTNYLFHKYNKKIVGDISDISSIVRDTIVSSNKRFILLPYVIYSSKREILEYNMILYDTKNNLLECYVNSVKYLLINKFIQVYFKKIFDNDKLKYAQVSIEFGYPTFWFLDYRLRNKDASLKKLYIKARKVKNLDEIYIAYSQFISKMAQNYRIVYEKNKKYKIDIKKKSPNDHYWYKKLVNKFNSVVYGITKKSI